MIGQREAQVYPLYGQYKFGGNIEFPLFPNSGIALLVGAIGADVKSGAGDPFTHTISPANTLPSFTIEKNLGGAQSEQYAGCRVSKYVLSWTTGDEAVKVTADVVGQSIATLTTPTAVSITTADVPFVFPEVSLSLLGNAIVTPTQFSLSWDNQIKSTWTAAQSHNVTYLTPMARKVNGQVTVVWNSLNDATYGWLAKMPVGAGSATQGTLVCTIAHAGSPSRSVAFTLNSVQLAKLTDDIKMNDVIMTQLDYEANYVIGSSLGQAVVLNSVATAY